MAAATDKRNFIGAEYPRLETLQVSEPVCFLRLSPKPSGAAGTELIFGEKFHVHRREAFWVWGRSESALPGATFPGYVGWVRKSNLSPVGAPPNYRVTALSAPVFSNRSIKSRVKFCLPLGSVLTGRIEDSFLKTKNGFLHARHVDPIGNFAKIDWVSIAESFLGQPYIWGGVSSFGADCSGLVQTALRAICQDAPRDSDQQASMGDPVKLAPLPELRRGDLIFWKGHVGIMQSADQIIHANAHHMAVASEPLKLAAERIIKSAGPITAIRRLNF